MIQFYARYIVVFLAALMFQSLIVPAIQIRTWKPDLILIFLVLFALQHGRIAGSTAGFFLGTFSDLMSSSLLGLGALTKSIAGYIAAVVGKSIQERNRFIITLIICGFLHDMIYYYINTLGQEIVWRILIIGQIIPNLLYTAIIGIGIYLFMGKWLTENE